MPRKLSHGTVRYEPDLPPGTDADFPQTDPEISLRRRSASHAVPAHPGRGLDAKTTPGARDDGTNDIELDAWGDDLDFIPADDLDDMPSDLRPSLDPIAHESRPHQPLLSAEDGEPPSGYDSYHRPPLSRRSTFHERDPEAIAKQDTRTRYTYAAGFLLLSLVSFAVQTETAVYIQTHLHWNKAYCMLYLTHGSWSLLWPTQLLILRIQKWHMPWDPFWKRHTQVVRQTAQMVQHQSLHLTTRQSAISPVRHMIKTTAFVTCALTVAGASWYVAVDLTSASDLTAIYNCSAFFAYAFSVPLLHEKVKASKVIAVAIAIVGVLIVAYGGGSPEDAGPDAPPTNEPKNRTLGNLVIGIGSVLYGFYEVLYKKVACPPDGTSPGRGMIFANTFGSCIGVFTLCVLWIPLPILHYMGWETFELPRGEAAWMMAISVLANATFSGSFLVLISLTSPVLSSVAALLTIFIVAIIDELLPEPYRSPLTGAAIVGGILITGAFLLLSWATYKEMSEERLHKLEHAEILESDLED